MLQITFQNARQASTTPFCTPGTVAQTPDGSVWKYVQAKASGIVKGAVVIPNTVVDVDTVSSSTDSLGRIVYITKASAGWTVGAYANQWVIVDDGTGVGQAGRIKTNTADTLELYPEYAFSTALSVADSDIAIVSDGNVIPAAVTSKLQNAQGIAQVAIANGSYAFVLQKGMGVVLAGEVLVLGADFVTGDDTVGQVVKGTTAKGAFDEQPLGKCRRANAGADQLTLIEANIF